MEVEIQPQENHKKGRQRKKLLYNSILQQMEFYFSDPNLNKDRFLRKLVDEAEYVDLDVFLKFNKIRKLTSSTEIIRKALKRSELLELSNDGTKVKRRTAVQEKQNTEECTIYVQHLKSDTTHEWLKNLFSEFGNVVYVSVPKYKHNKLSKGFAFIEFETEAEVENALKFFESIDCKISSHIDPEKLTSITNFEKEEPEDSVKDGNIKRKHSNDSDVAEQSNKKQKTEHEEEDATPETKVENATEADGKKKKKKSKRKTQFRELGLQVLPKKEWRMLRNRYLNMQRDKMKQLKSYLSRFSNKYDEKPSEENVKNKVEFTPGVIVRLQLNKPYTDPKKLKMEMKSGLDVQFVEIPPSVNSDLVYLRFLNETSSKSFCDSNNYGNGVILEGEEEQQYWEKIQRFSNKKDTKKQRGRNKLLKKAEQAIGKHITFDDD